MIILTILVLPNFILLLIEISALEFNKLAEHSSLSFISPKTDLTNDASSSDRFDDFENLCFKSAIALACYSTYFTKGVSLNISCIHSQHSVLHNYYRISVYGLL